MPDTDVPSAVDKLAWLAWVGLLSIAFALTATLTWIWVGARPGAAPAQHGASVAPALKADEPATPPPFEPLIEPPPARFLSPPTPPSQARPPGVRRSTPAAAASPAPPVPLPAGTPDAPEAPEPVRGEPTPSRATEPPISADGRQALELGARSEVDGDLTAALQHFQRAGTIDPQLAITSRTSIARVRQTMLAASQDARRRALLYDAVGRTEEAIEWYERALRNLSEDDPDRLLVSEQLATLRKRR